MIVSMQSSMPRQLIRPGERQRAQIAFVFSHSGVRKHVLRQAIPRTELFATGGTLIVLRILMCQHVCGQCMLTAQHSTTNMTRPIARCVLCHIRCDKRIIGAFIATVQWYFVHFHVSSILQLIDECDGTSLASECVVVGVLAAIHLRRTRAIMSLACLFVVELQRTQLTFVLVHRTAFIAMLSCVAAKHKFLHAIFALVVETRVFFQMVVAVAAFGE